MHNFMGLRGDNVCINFLLSWSLLDTNRHHFFFLFFILFLEHGRRLTTWLVFRRVERRIHDQESNHQPLRLVWVPFHLSSGSLMYKFENTKQVVRNRGLHLKNTSHTKFKGEWKRHWKTLSQKEGFVIEIPGTSYCCHLEVKFHEPSSRGEWMLPIIGFELIGFHVHSNFVANLCDHIWLDTRYVLHVKSERLSLINPQ